MCALKKSVRWCSASAKHPLGRVHLRNMTWAAEAGATIYPLIPTFYNRPSTLPEMATSSRAACWHS